MYQIYIINQIHKDNIIQCPLQLCQMTKLHLQSGAIIQDQLVKKKHYNSPDAFGNTRHYIDIFGYFFSKRKILMMPDFNTIFSNYSEKFLWGTSEKEITRNLKKNKTNYFLLERKKNNLPKHLSSKKYKIISIFNFTNKFNEITPKPFDKKNLLLVKFKA